MSGDLKTAVKDAYFVLAQVRVGKLDARIKHEQIPQLLRHSGREMAKSIIGIIGKLNFSYEEEIDLVIADR